MRLILIEAPSANTGLEGYPTILDEALIHRSGRRPYMKFYTKQHPFYRGIDLHARMLCVCILNGQGETVVHKNIKAKNDKIDSLKIAAFVIPPLIMVLRSRGSYAAC
jgi:hypothetical protein